jgi:methionyl-tRNA formyltransferase
VTDSKSNATFRVVLITVVPAVAQGYTEIIRSLGHEPVAVIATRRRAAGAPLNPLAPAILTDAPAGLDTLFPETRRSIAPLLRAYEPDLAICTGYPWLIPAEALEVPRLGIVNGHPSLLPRYRGPFPVAWAVRNGEEQIGLTYHLMDAAFDTGPVLAQTSLPLGADETWESLQGRLGEAAPALLSEVFERLARGERGDPQVGEGEYQSAFEDDYRFVDLTQTAAEVHRQTRAWSFVPPILPELGPILERDGTKVRLLRTSLTEVAGAERLDCADGPLWLVETTSV